MAASINDKLIQAENGGNPQPTTVSSARSIGATSLSCVALTNWPTATAVHLITYQKKTDGTMDRTTLCLWKGIVSGTTIGTLTLKGGTDAGNSVGDFVEMAPTSSQWQDLYDGLTTEHKTTGKHSDVTFDSLTANSGASVDFSNAPLAPTDIALTKTTDANGWTVYDFGGFKEYSMTVIGVTLGNLAPSATPTVVKNNILPPTGFANFSQFDLNFSIACAAWSTFVIFGVQPADGAAGVDTATKIQIQARNIDPSTTAFPGYVYGSVKLKTRTISN